MSNRHPLDEISNLQKGLGGGLLGQCGIGMAQQQAMHAANQQLKHPQQYFDHQALEKRESEKEAMRIAGIAKEKEEAQRVALLLLL